MKVRTFVLVIDGRKIDSCSGVRLGDCSQFSLGRQDYSRVRGSSPAPCVVVFPKKDYTGGVAFGISEVVWNYVRTWSI